MALHIVIKLIHVVGVLVDFLLETSSLSYHWWLSLVEGLLWKNKTEHNEGLIQVILLSHRKCMSGWIIYFTSTNPTFWIYTTMQQFIFIWPFLSVFPNIMFTGSRVNYMSLYCNLISQKSICTVGGKTHGTCKVMTLIHVVSVLVEFGLEASSLSYHWCLSLVEWTIVKEVWVRGKSWLLQLKLYQRRR